jgi:hypothetical protein
MSEPGSSVSTASGYGLDGRTMQVRFPIEAKDFSYSICVQTGSEAHPASCPMGTGILFPKVKRGRGVTLTTHPHPVPRSWMSMSYTSSPPCASICMLWGCSTCITCEGYYVGSTERGGKANSLGVLVLERSWNIMPLSVRLRLATCSIPSSFQQTRTMSLLKYNCVWST